MVLGESGVGIWCNQESRYRAVQPLLSCEKDKNDLGMPITNSNSGLMLKWLQSGDVVKWEDRLSVSGESLPTCLLSSVSSVSSDRCCGIDTG